MKFLFWLSVGLISYTFFGYPFLLLILSILFGKPIHKKRIVPFVSIIISVCNEEKIIETKIKNCLELDYPKDKLEVIIGSDGSSDTTNEIVGKYVSRGIKFYKWAKKRGKPGVLNDLVSQANGEIIVFTDTRQIFQKDVLKELTENFSDENVGCVNGELILDNKEKNSMGGGVGLYWKYEKFLRRKESQIGSTIGATGAIYAIRKRLYIPPPSDTILDDVFIPMRIVDQGYRAIFEPKARAYDEISQDFKEEFARKVRTLCGNWQIFVKLKHMFNPFKSRVAFQFFSHKLLRVLVPYFLIVIFIANLCLLDITFYKIILILQVIFYLFAFFKILFSKLRISIFNIPYTFCMLNLAAVKGLSSFLGNKQGVTWKR